MFPSIPVKVVLPVLWLTTRKLGWLLTVLRGKFMGKVLGVTV